MFAPPSGVVADPPAPPEPVPGGGDEPPPGAAVSEGDGIGAVGPWVIGNVMTSVKDVSGGGRRLRLLWELTRDRCRLANVTRHICSCKARWDVATISRARESWSGASATFSDREGLSDVAGRTGIDIGNRINSSVNRVSSSGWSWSRRHLALAAVGRCNGIGARVGYSLVILASAFNECHGRVALGIGARCSANCK